jgi:hypothetical protein
MGSNKASLHNGPISAQDLATGMREREAAAAMPGISERPSHSDDEGKCESPSSLSYLASIPSPREYNTSMPVSAVLLF